MTPTCLVGQGGPCDAETASIQEDDHAALCWQALRTTVTGQPGSAHRKAMPARQPLEMSGRYRFHSTRPALWKRVSVASSVDRQSKGGVNFRRTTRRCFSVWLSRSGKAWEDRPARAIRHPLIPRHSTQVRDGRRALCRGATFDLWCRGCQATSSITSSLPLNEIASPARLPSNSA